MTDLYKVRWCLDQLRDHGWSEHDIYEALKDFGVHANARTVRKWYSGKSTCLDFQYRALRKLTREVTDQ